MECYEPMKNLVEKFGWIVIGNIFADNGLNINPISSDGCVCMNPAFVFATSVLPTDIGGTVENDFLVVPDLALGHQQAIVCINMDQIQHFDVLLLRSDKLIYDGKIPFPELPKPADVEAMESDTTGLYPNTNTTTLHSGTKISALNIYPELPIEKATSLRVDTYKRFLRNQKIFKETVQEIFGLSDCI